MNKIIPFLLVAGGLFLFMGLKKGSQEKNFSIPPNLIPQLPNGGTIAESQLPAYGFVNVPQVGWVHNSQIKGTGQYAGAENSSNWMQTLSNMISQGYSYFQIVANTGLIPAISRSVTAISSNFPTSVTVKIMIGSIQETKTINKNTSISKVSTNGLYAYSVFPMPGKTIIFLFVDGEKKQTSEIIWNTQQFVNFQSAGIGSICGAGGFLLQQGKPLGGKILGHCKASGPSAAWDSLNKGETTVIKKTLGQTIEGLKEGPHSLF